MKNKIKYTDEPLGRLSVVKDFLPSPEELVFLIEGKLRQHGKKHYVATYFVQENL